MPTSKPRHTVTEVGEIAEAFARARRIRPEIGARELIVLGAEALVEHQREHERDSQVRLVLRQRLLERVTQPDGIDREALAEARWRWACELDEL